MFVVTAVPVAILLCVFTMLGWGSRDLPGYRGDDRLTGVTAGPNL